MHKKTMLTALIALGFVTPIISNTGASAATLNQNNPTASAIIQKMNQPQSSIPKLTEDSPKLSEKQLKIQDSDIETWMPNPSVREAVLGQLIKRGYLPKGSTVNDITKDLLGSVKLNEKIGLSVNAFEDGQITPNLTEGLQYFSSQAYVFIQIVDADDSKLSQLDFAQLNQNVDEWHLYVVNPEKVASTRLTQKIIDAKVPKKEDNLGVAPKISYLRANYVNDDRPVAPVPSKSIDISKTLSPTINLTIDDFWTYRDQSVFLTHPGLISGLVNKDNVVGLQPGEFYSFKETSDGNFLGTLPETDVVTSAMQRIDKDPQNFYATLWDIEVHDDNQYQKFSVYNIIYASFHK
ncbi:hypothetical protein GBP13_02975 [Pediococcus acidilactici]|uniref:hypothetical protein n=1 Tax=Pediococcus acidilactici TaxID=1254 RepID=UPI0013280383|nr:hypothetical protein [Pediococcus acidilactici]KAF0364142.1 hypothetical protein GBO50_02970 [Pediococcus acidilactici]KAF0368218.1 hypothetical protein GBO55_03670 [Pediococcus acidilactici]KAF0419912.1 hypothetical protein GBO80_00095 [Pediococcus acidilactici]KAF0424097.1 hypothetical protein GBO82_00095 [Pediococcus acidilactici]KAF0474190.1 hypothetical protein GBP08_02975 [Pediococcus acidilactici]